MYFLENQKLALVLVSLKQEYWIKRSIAEIPPYISI